MPVYRYYCRYRPPMPGAIPGKGITNWMDFNWKQPFDGISAWGWVEYDHQLSEQEIRDYELTPSPNNPLTYDQK